MKVQTDTKFQNFMEKIMSFMRFNRKKNTQMQLALSQAMQKSIVKPKTEDTASQATKPEQVPVVVKHTFSRKDSCNDETLNAQDPYLFELLDMISIRRRDKTETEILFCEAYFNFIKTPFGDKQFTKYFTKHFDEKGGLIAYTLKVSDAPILWSSHVDSVHNGAGRVNVTYDSFLQTAYVSDSASPLGADDAAGMWILFQMIRANVPGTYIFHKAEEVGGVGSRAMAKNHPEFLKMFKYAIAFDRKGNTSVITHQGGKRCCSDAFADSFISAIKPFSTDYKKDDTGVFTDTKNYIDLIAECTNISCGYMHEHTTAETLDVEHLITLKNAVISAFKGGIDSLVCSRKPGDAEFKTYTSPSYNKPKVNSDNAVTSFSRWKEEKEKKDKYKEFEFDEDTDNDPFFPERDPYFNKYAKAVPKAPKFEKELGKKSLPKTYFDIHSLSAEVADELEVMESEKYQGFEEKILDVITRLSDADYDEVEKMIEDTHMPILVCTIKKLLWEARF